MLDIKNTAKKYDINSDITLKQLYVFENRKLNSYFLLKKVSNIRFCVIICSTKSQGPC